MILPSSIQFPLFTMERLAKSLILIRKGPSKILYERCVYESVRDVYIYKRTSKYHDDSF